MPSDTYADYNVLPVSPKMGAHNSRVWQWIEVCAPYIELSRIAQLPRAVQRVLCRGCRNNLPTRILALTVEIWIPTSTPCISLVRMAWCLALTHCSIISWVGHFLRRRNPAWVGYGILKATFTYDEKEIPICFPMVLAMLPAILGRVLGGRGTTSIR